MRTFNYIENLVARSLSEAVVIQPRPVSLFEPGLGVERGAISEPALDDVEDWRIESATELTPSSSVQAPLQTIQPVQTHQMPGDRPLTHETVQRQPEDPLANEPVRPTQVVSAPQPLQAAPYKVQPAPRLPHTSHASQPAHPQVKPEAAPIQPMPQTALPGQLQHRSLQSSSSGTVIQQPALPGNEPSVLGKPAPVSIPTSVQQRSPRSSLSTSEQVESPTTEVVTVREIMEEHLTLPTPATPIPAKRLPMLVRVSGEQPISVDRTPHRAPAPPVVVHEQVIQSTLPARDVPAPNTDLRGQPLQPRILPQPKPTLATVVREQVAISVRPAVTVSPTRGNSRPPSNRQPLFYNSQSAGHHPQPSVQPEAAPTIQVTIGRIEIRATPTSAPAKAEKKGPQAPRMSLDDYLRQRNGEQR